MTIADTAIDYSLKEDSIQEISLVQCENNTYTNINYKGVSNNIQINPENDKYLTDFGKAILLDRYLQEGELYQDLFARVSTYYGDDSEHAQRLYDYISNLWFMPSTPVLSNGGTSRGLPISCFLNETNDSLSGIVDMWNENVWLASKGGGIGSYWGNLRSIGEKVKGSGKTSGIIPFIVVQDSLTLAISQGSLRRGSSAVYLPVWHPEIEEFLELRRVTGGDPNRKALNIHHGIIVNDEFMKAVEQDLDWGLKSPKCNQVMHTVKARELWIKILTCRVETGEPYIIYGDAVNNNRPEIYKNLDLQVKMSNLCSEIMLATGIDHKNEERTAVCCLSSLNVENYEKWCDNEEFIIDIMKFLDNVLTDFINKAPIEMKKAVYSANRERSVGLGVMGFHSFLQQKNIPFDSVMAKVWNKKIFAHMKEGADKASVMIADERGACPDALDAGIHERFVNKTAVAPTASISVIAGNSSPGIEPYAANVFVQKTLTGSFTVKNKNLVDLLEKKGLNTEKIWSSIATNEGSVQHLDELDDHEKNVFRTAYELNQFYVIEHAADRTPYICQSQSVNIFLPADVHKRILHQIHMQAWKKGVKSLYYCRSRSLQRADKVSHKTDEISHLTIANETGNDNDKYQECLSCQ